MSGPRFAIGDRVVVIKSSHNDFQTRQYIGRSGTVEELSAAPYVKMDDGESVCCSQIELEPATVALTKTPPVGTRVRILHIPKLAHHRSQNYAGQVGVTVDTDGAPNVRLDSGAEVCCYPRELTLVPEAAPVPFATKAEALRVALSEYANAIADKDDADARATRATGALAALMK